MSGRLLGQTVMGAALVVMSCGGSGGQIGDAGNGGGGQAGSGGATGQMGGAGGGSSGCATVSPCGGDIVGTWKVTQSCLTATEDLSSTCAGASANLTYAFSGTLTYNADLTYSSAITGTTTVHEYFPSGCKPFGFTCVQLGQIAMDAGIPDNCSTDATGACNCDAVTPLTPANAPPGTYSISGSTLTTTTQGGTMSTGPYCVQGGVLYEIPGSQDGGLAAMGGIVLTKQ